MTRVTRQRAAIASALAAEDGFRSAQELHAILRAGGRDVGLTTVYRNLQALAEAGEVDVLRADDGEARYRMCPTVAHHHHLVCRGCGRSVEVEAPDVEQLVARLAHHHGFHDVAHTLELAGTCADCVAG